nr:putative ribonuclease H-like domain-containing protein [Tanacetum cinerariifolium]
MKGVGFIEYCDVPPPLAQVYLPPKKDLSWMGLPGFVDDTVTDYTRPTPSIDVSKSVIKEQEEIWKRKTWTRVNHAQDNMKYTSTHKSMTPRAVVLKSGTKPIDRPFSTARPTLKSAQPKMTSFVKTARSNVIRPFERKSTAKNKVWSPTIRPRFPLLAQKFPLLSQQLLLIRETREKLLRPQLVGFRNISKFLLFKDTGFSRHMTGNISYLSEYEPFNGGYMSFGHERGKINGKDSIKTGKLEFENVYFIEELKYNLFSVSQICDNKNSVLFTDIECLVLGKDFKLVDDKHVLLRTHRQQNMYTIDLKNVVPHKNLTYRIAKALVDESMLWHRRLGHLNFKTLNKLVRSNLVKGFPSKSFGNDHSCVACLKGKQHKASCKSKLVNSVSKPLYTLHMDFFGPTYVSSLNHKWYCLVVIDDFSRFSWTFFLKSKDETSRILRNFITEIENIKDLKVKIIKSDNGGEFRNKEIDEFCSKKGIKREFSNARTPQQNGVVKRRNRTLIEAARTMLADAKLRVTFWAEAVNTACYVQNRVLVTKSHNKTPYELFNERYLAIGFLRPFGCPVMILNTLDHLGKFDAKGDEKIEENLHVDFLENKSIEKGTGPDWLFDIETLTNSMNYILVVVAGTSSTNISGTREDVHQAVKDKESPLRFISLSNGFHEAQMATSNEAAKKDDTRTPQKEQQRGGSTFLETLSLGNAMSFENRLEYFFGDTSKADSLNEVEDDLSNMETAIQVTLTPTLRIHKDHPKSQITGHVDTPVLTRQKTKDVDE